MDKLKKAGLIIGGSILTGGLALLGAKKLKKGETIEDIEEDCTEVEFEEAKEEK